MSAFEHLMTLASFILALGIGTVLLSVATLVHKREQVKLSLPPMLWMGWIFISQINVWLVAYNYHDVTRWPYVTIVFLVIVPAILFLQAAIIVPDQSGSLDLAEHHRRNFRWYAGLAVCESVLSLLNLLLSMIMEPGPEFAVPPPVFVLVGLRVVVAVAAVTWSARWVQIAAPAILLTMGVTSFFSGSAALAGFQYDPGSQTGLSGNAVP